MCVLWERAILNTCPRGTNSNSNSSSEFQKPPRITAARHNSNSSGTTPVNIATLMCIGAPVSPSFQLAAPPGISSHPRPEGKPCILLHLCIGICQVYDTTAIIRLFAFYQLLLGWKTYKYYYETDELPPTQGQPNPRKIWLKKRRFGPLFCIHSKCFFFRGLGLIFM